MLVLLWKFPEGNSGVDSISPFDFAPEVELDMSITRPMAEIKEATQLKVPTQIAVGTPQFCSTHGVTRVLTTDPGFIEKEERQSLIAISRNVIRLLFCYPTKSGDTQIQPKSKGQLMPSNVMTIEISVSAMTSLFFMRTLELLFFSILL